MTRMDTTGARTRALWRVSPWLGLALLGALGMAPAQAQTPGDAAPAGKAVAGAARSIEWVELMPAGWDPFKDLKSLNWQSLRDNDPRADDALKKMRKVWDSAPVNPALVGQSVRLSGFVVPLEDRDDGMTEFLLVPYFGACIHSPPPPANQIIHVLLAKPVKRVGLTDTVWVSGSLSAEKTDSHMGVAGYRMYGTAVTPYVEPKADRKK